MATITAMAEALPHLLVEVPEGELTPEVRRTMIRLMQQQLNDDAVAVKLGRAFMLGRLHSMQEVRDAFDPFGKPACETIDECNLYAGGYQYDLKDGVNGNARAILLRKFLRMEREGSDARLEKALQIVDELRVLDVREQQEGLSLEIVARRCDLRISLGALTVENLMTVVKTLEIRLLMGDDTEEDVLSAADAVETLLSQAKELKGAS